MKWTEQEQGGPNRIEWTNVDQIRTNGQIRTKVDIMYRIGTYKTELGQVGSNRTTVNQIGPMSTKQDQSEHNRPNEIEVDRI